MRGTNYSFPSSEQMQVSLLVNQLSVNFTAEEKLTLRAFAANSLGTSDPLSATIFVPCECTTRGGLVYNLLGFTALDFLLL